MLCMHIVHTDRATEMSYIHLKYDVQCSEIHFFQTNRHQSDEDSPPDTAWWLRLVWWWKCFKAPEVGWNWLNQKKLRVTKSLNNNCCYQQEFLRNFTRMMVNTDRIINSLIATNGRTMGLIVLSEWIHCLWHNVFITWSICKVVYNVQMLLFLE